MVNFELVHSNIIVALAIYSYAVRSTCGNMCLVGVAYETRQCVCYLVF